MKCCSLKIKRDGKKVNISRLKLALNAVIKAKLCINMHTCVHIIGILMKLVYIICVKYTFQGYISKTFS